MNKDKQIKDLKERNFKLTNQYKQLEIRFYSLEQEHNKLKKQHKKAIEYIKSWILDEYSIAIIDKEDDCCCYTEPNAREILLEILGDKE